MLKKLICLLALLTLLIPAAFAEPDLTYVTMYVHTEDGGTLNVRSTPETGGNVIGHLKFGAEVTVIEFLSGGWCSIEWKNDSVAYVQKRFLAWYVDPEEAELLKKKKAELASEVSVDPFMVQVRAGRASGWVSLRQDPVKNSKAVETCENGKELRVIAKTDHYYKAEDPETGKTGYIYQDYTKALPAEQKDARISKLNINGKFIIQGTIPEGYKMQVLSIQPTRTLAKITSPNKKKPVMRLSLSYFEEYANIERLNDMTEQQIEELKATFSDYYDVEFSERETAYGTKVMVVREVGDAVDFVCFFTVYKGYEVEFLLTPSENTDDQKLSDEQIQMCIDFLSGMDFIPVEDDETQGQ